MLRMPAEGDVPPPLHGKGRKFLPVSLPDSLERAREGKSLPDTEGAVPVLQPEEKGERHKRRHHPHKDEQPDWEKETAVRVRKKGGGFLGRGIAIAFVILATVGVLLVLVKRKTPSPTVSLPARSAPVPKKPENALEKKPEEQALPAELAGDQAQLLSRVNSAARTFLEADTVEKLLPLIRNPEKVGPKLREWYPDGKVPAVGLSRPADTVGVVPDSKIIFSKFFTRDFDEKQIAFFDGDGGLKVDWESYVGWSEIPWSEFIAERPSKPLLFRVSLNKEEYYNFDYSDDAKWQSYRMVSPDGQHILYGYARKDSAVVEALRMDEAGETLKTTLLLRFQGGGDSKNQVLIEKIVADGWIEREPAK